MVRKSGRSMVVRTGSGAPLSVQHRRRPRSALDPLRRRPMPLPLWRVPEANRLSERHLFPRVLLLRRSRQAVGWHPTMVSPHPPVLRVRLPARTPPVGPPLVGPPLVGPPRPAGATGRRTGSGASGRHPGKQSRQTPARCGYAPDSSSLLPCGPSLHPERSDSARWQRAH